VTAPYSVGDVVLAGGARGRAGVAGEVYEVGSGRYEGKVRVRRHDGTRRLVWWPVSQVRPVTERRSLKLSVPEVSEEADSFEAARERSTGSVKAELAAVPKAPKPKRSASHLDYVRSLPCCVTGRTDNVVAHHVENAGMGRKCSDLLTVPLTAEMHDYYHQHGFLPNLGPHRTRALFWESIGRTLAAKLEEGGRS
jgi:hypothetical protein